MLRTPFGLDLDEFLAYASGQFQGRMQRIEKALEASPEDVFRQIQVEPNTD